MRQEENRHYFRGYIILIISALQQRAVVQNRLTCFSGLNTFTDTSSISRAFQPPVGNRRGISPPDGRVSVALDSPVLSCLEEVARLVVLPGDRSVKRAGKS